MEDGTFATEESGSAIVPEAASAPAGGEVYDLSYEALAEDFTGYVDHVALTGEFYLAQMQRTRRLVAMALAAAAIAFALLSWDLWLVLLMTVIFAAAGLIFWVTWPRRWRAEIRKNGQRQIEMENPLVVYGPKRYIIGPDAVRFSGLHTGGYVAWPAVMRVSHDERAIYLHVSQASAHILPRRAFATSEEFERLAAQAEAWRRASATIPSAS